MSVGLVAAGVATVAGAAIAADASRSASNKARDAANAANETANKSLDAQTQQADALLEFQKQQYADGKERQVGIDAINKQVIDQNLDLSAKAGQRADETYDFYKQYGRPVVQKTLDDANNYDSQGNIDAARGRAAADVQQASDSAEQQTQRALTRMGVNPSSGRFLALQQRMQADKAANLAGAETNAEQGIRTQALGLRQQASNLAQGFPAQSLGQGNQSSATGVVAAGVAGAGGAQNLALGQQAINAMATGASIYGSATGGYTNLAGLASSNANFAAQQGASNAAGWGNLAGNLISNFGGAGGGGGGFQTIDHGGIGMGSIGQASGTWTPAMGYANGGKVIGPGTGTSDSVPAVNTTTGGPVKLSNGEYVLSADTVRAVGTKFLDKLQEKHHRPVGNLGRGN